MTIKFGMTSLDAEPIMSLDKFIERTGLFAVTVWRYRKNQRFAGLQYAARHAVPQPVIPSSTERQRIAEEIDAAMIFARSTCRPVPLPE